MQTTSSPSIALVHNTNHRLHHSANKHPEAPERLDSILARLKSSKFIKDCAIIDTFSATPEVLSLAHDANYINMVKGLKDYEGDSYSTPHSHTVAELAASGACLAVDKVLSNEFKHAFCLIRPPGHHANRLKNCLTGFCVYNNVAIAAYYARKHHNLKKILVFDWDVHHGDSTQQIFENDPDLLFISLHKYQQGGFFPGNSGAMHRMGTNEGKGYNINCPWDIGENAGCCRTVGDNEYVYVMESVLMPIIKSFRPELIFVSAGFDAANGDPLGGCSISPFGYSYMLKRLMSFGTKVIVSLEGGYNPDVNAMSAEYCTRTLLDEQLPLNNAASKWSLDNMKENCIPNKVALDLVEVLVLNFVKLWPVLEDKEAVAYRDQVKENVKRFYSEDKVFSSHLSSVIRKNKLWKQSSFGGQLLLKQAQDEKSRIGESLKSISEYLPVLVKQGAKQGMKFSVYDLGLEDFERCSYFVMKIGCDSLEETQENYQNKNARLLKLVWRNEEYKIMDKWDQYSNYGVNYDMKIDDWNHDKFIFFMKYFLESHDASKANFTAYKYFRNFIVELDEWIKKNTRVTFSSLTIGFFLDNVKREYRACVLDLEDVVVTEKEEQNHNPTVAAVLHEMRETLFNDEGFITD